MFYKSQEPSPPDDSDTFMLMPTSFNCSLKLVDLSDLVRKTPGNTAYNLETVPSPNQV